MIKKVKDEGKYPKIIEETLASTDPKMSEGRKLVKLVHQLIHKEPTKRPLAKDLYSEFEDELFQEYLIQNQNEFTKMVGSLFKNRFKFESVKEMSMVDEIESKFNKNNK